MNTMLRAHPVSAFAYFVSVLLISMFVFHPVYLVLSLLGAVSFWLISDKNKRLLKLGMYFGIFIFVALTNPIFSQNGDTRLFEVFGRIVTMESIFYGCLIGIMLVSVMLWCSCMSKVLTEDKFLYIFGRFMPKLSLVLSMALRFIPVFMRRSEKVRRASKAMGLDAMAGKKAALRNSMRVLTATTEWSLENAIDTSSAMQARGYGITKRSRYSLFIFCASDIIFLVAIILFLIPVIFSLLGALGDFVVYPRISEIKTTPQAIFGYTTYAILAFIPTMLEIKERIQWNYYKSKM